MSQEIYSNIDEFLSALDEDQPNPSPENKEFSTDLYKKWFRSKSQSGFLAIRPWFDALKFKIDIGKTSSDGKLLSSTNVFVDSIDLAAYLRSIANQTAVVNFPVNEKTNIPTPEGFVSYGGAVIEGKPISRIFKSHYWQSGETFDSTSFVWKCGHFAAKKSDSGAFIPDMKQMISMDTIKVTRQDICSISYLLDLSLTSYVTNNTDWYE
jgi:hypothetical protein